jgi:hypothetical protein
MAYPFVAITALGQFGKLDPVEVGAYFGGKNFLRLILADDIIIEKGFQFLRF